ncbi:MAG: AAA family ATPase [Pirellulales bacterium]
MNLPHDPSVRRCRARSVDVALGRRCAVGRSVSSREATASPRSATTYRALDAEGREFTVRTLVATEAVAQQAHLEHEVGILQSLPPEQFAVTVEFGRVDDLLYWVRPHVAGTPLECNPSTPTPTVEEALRFGSALFSCLVELHDRRTLCRNLQPANLIVPVDGAAGNFVLTDYGLGAVMGDDEAAERSINDVLYLSPEQAGSLDCDVAAPADLYAAGALYFHYLTGRPPYEGPTVGAVLLRHMTAHVPKLRSLGLDVPRTLDEIVQRLLRKDPRDRYQSAAAVVADLQKLAEAWQAGEQDPQFVVGLADRRRTLTEPAFVSRSRELQQLDVQLKNLRLGRGGVVALETESGGGKSRLLDEVAQRARCQAIWVLRGIGTNDVGQKPFQVLDGIVQEVIAAVGGDVPLRDRLRERLGDRRSGVVAVLPQLAEILGRDDSRDLGPEAFAEARSIQALVHLLDALGAAGRPALVMLDDCQWADESAVKLILQWSTAVTERAAGANHVSLIAAFRSEEVEAGHALRTLQPSLHLRLARFKDDDLRRLIESMAGPLPDEIVDAVTTIADGSPFMASAVLRGSSNRARSLPKKKVGESNVWPWRICNRRNMPVRFSRIVLICCRRKPRDCWRREPYSAKSSFGDRRSSLPGWMWPAPRHARRGP